MTQKSFSGSGLCLSTQQIQHRAQLTVAIEDGAYQDARAEALLPFLQAMLYDEALVCGVWRLELVYLAEGMPHFRLYWQDIVFGVADIYADKADIGSSRKLPLVRHALAAFLVACGWTPEDIRGAEAITPIEADVKRQYRLFKLKVPKIRYQDYDMLRGDNLGRSVYAGA